MGRWASVEPVAWIGPDGQLMLNEIYVAWRKRDPDKAAQYKPLFYDQRRDGVEE